MTDDGKRLGSDQMTTALLDAEARIRELKRQLEAADKHAMSLESILTGISSWDGEAPTHVIVPKPEWEYLKGFHDGVCKNGTHVVVPVEQPTIPELPNDMQEFADRHKLGTFIQEVWRQAFRDAHRAMIRAAQPERQQGE